VEESFCSSKPSRQEMILKRRRDSNSRISTRGKAIVAIKAILAVAMLLSLFAGNIVWPASASGPLCTLACCAGRAAHVAGSCMDGSCSTSHSEHLHHATPDDDQSTTGSLGRSPLGKVSGGAHGSNMDDVETVDATEQTTPSDNSVPSLSSAVFTKPCPPGCGSAVTSFGNLNRPPHAAQKLRLINPQAQTQALRATNERVDERSASVGTHVPRGPPLSSLS
jgi:hypothetical protein